MGTMHVTHSKTMPLHAVRDTDTKGEAASAKSAEQAEKISLFERLAKRYGAPCLAKVMDRQKLVRDELKGVPGRMQKVTNQAALVLELFEDFRANRYRAIPWHSIAMAAAALLYSVSPSDVVPDILPGVGALDDILVISLAMRWMRKDLEAYIAFKGYDSAQYF